MWYNDYLHTLIHDQQVQDAQREVRQARLIREAGQGAKPSPRLPVLLHALAALIGRWFPTMPTIPVQQTCSTCRPADSGCQPA